MMKQPIKKMPPGISCTAIGSRQLKTEVALMLFEFETP